MLLLVLLCCICFCSGSSIPSRLSKRLLELEQSCAREQGRSVPLIVPAFGPDDVGADGTMEGNEIAWIEKTIAAHRRSGNGSIMYFVYNLKHPRIVEKLLEAYTSGVRVQIMIEASTFSGARYKIHNMFQEKGMPVFKDRKLMSSEQASGSFFSGAKVGSLFHVKSRLFEFEGQSVLLTGSLNPGTESMQNDESIYTIRSPELIAKYKSFLNALVFSQERQFVNTWNDNAALNVLFSPSKGGYDIGTKILDWIDAENEFIFITVFSLNVFGEKAGQRNLFNSLKNAANRGVEIWIVTDRKQSDGFSGFGDVFEDLIRGISPKIIVYEVTNDIPGQFNAMHLKDAVFGITNVKVVTDTSNWSSAAFGSCSSIVKSQIVAKACSSAASAESSLFIDGAKFGNHFGFRVLRHHITLLDRYWRQIPIQKTNDPSPQDAWNRLYARFGDKILFVRTAIFVQATTSPGEYIELRGATVSGANPELSYCNSLNLDTLPLKRSYRKLSWEEGLAMDWTADSRSGSQTSYVNNGYGHDPENDVPSPQGSNWWKALIYVDGKRGDWIEFKLVKTRGLAGDVIAWERDIDRQNAQITPADTDHSNGPRSVNHLARLGYTTRTIFRPK